MPVFKSGRGLAPDWCEMERFEILHLCPGQTHKFDCSGTKEKLIVGEGKCRVTFEGRSVEAKKTTNLDLTTPDGHFEVADVSEETTLIRMCGRWGEDLGGSGLFHMVRSDAPKDVGDPADYPKATNFDKHFHDCDEYWIVYKGRGTIYSEGEMHPIGLGECLATGMGHHHDLPLVEEPIHAVFFETTMEGQKRRGHLWEHTHGKAQPQMERV